MRVLTIVHGFPPAAGGGTEIYVHDLVAALDRGFADEILVLTREADPSRPEYAVRRERRGGVEIAWINHDYRACRSFEDSYRHARVRRIGAALADEWRPDVAHVHHLTHLSIDLVPELARRRVPVVFTLNDYWLICHRGQLVDLDGRRCDGPGQDGCPRCVPDELAAWGAGALAPWWRRLAPRLPAPLADAGRRAGSATASALAPGAGRRASARRLAAMRALIPHVSVFLAPSRTLRDEFLTFGIPADRLLAQEQGIDQTRLRHLRRQPGNRLRLGFLGSLMVSKAPHLLLEAVAGLPPDRLSVTLHGAVQPYHGDDSYRARLAPLLAQPAVWHAGPLPHEDVPRALEVIDVLVVPSIWLENAPFIIREAFAAGVPVVASNLGGMAELVTHDRNGLLFAPGDAADLRRTITRLLDEPGLLDRLRDGVPRMKTIEEDAAWTRQVYAAHLRAPGRAVAVAPGQAPAPSGRRLAAVVLNYRTPGDTAVAIRSLRASRRAVDDILVVDNGSRDGSADALRRSCPDAVVIESDTNLGFAAGANLGIRQALDRGAGLVLLVNSDTIVPPDTIERLEAGLDDPAIGIVAPVVLARERPSRVGSCGMRFTPATARMVHPEAGADAAALDLPAIHPVDGVSGCAMLVRRDVFERAGLFDEGYFFFFEDLDLCLRAAGAGLKTACVTSALAWHEGSRSIGRRSPTRLYHATRSHLRMARTAGRPSAGRAAWRSLSVVAFNLAYALAGTSAGRASGVLAVARGVADELGGRAVTRP